MGMDWDARYRESPGPAEPAVLLTDFAHLLPARGRALDIACGNGRNSVWLAERGLDVVAIDLSAEALRLGRELAARRGDSVSWLQADVETLQLDPNAYEIIVCINLLAPTLFPKLQRALRPNGWVVYETYTLAQLQYDFGPRNPDHLLRPGELLAAFSNLRIAYYHEAVEARAVASVIAQKTLEAVW
jgi:tellurite methyltransferase